MSFKVVKSRKKKTLIISAADYHSSSIADGILIEAIKHAIKSDFNRNHPWRVVIILLEENSTLMIERLSLLDLTRLGMNVECLVVDDKDKKLKPLQIYSQYELLNLHPHELVWPENADSYPLYDLLKQRIINLAPDLVEIRKKTGSQVESYSINGLEFARVNRGNPNVIRFGITGMQNYSTSTEHTVLNEANFYELKILVDNLKKYRSADSPDKTHPYYKLRSEAWLESLIRKDVRVIDPNLSNDFVYSQIPAWQADKRSIIDLLTVNHDGRLVIIEIKASEDIQLPLQGLDYWLRIEQARLRNEFISRRLFKDIRIADAPPLLYLVAPQLRFHRSFSQIASCISASIDTFKIGINSNWRNDVKVRTFKRVN